MRIMEELGFFSALGVVIVFVAGTALGRVASVTSGIRPVEPEPVPAETVPAETVPAETVPAETAPMGAVPASTGPRLPLRTRADAVPAKADAVPAKNVRTDSTDTTQTIG